VLGYYYIHQGVSWCTIMCDIHFTWLWSLGRQVNWKVIKCTTDSSVLCRVYISPATSCLGVYNPL